MIEWEIQYFNNTDDYEKTSIELRTTPTISYWCYTIGIKGEKGGSNFHLGVGNILWLKNIIQESGPFLLKHIIIVEDFDDEQINNLVIDEIKRNEPFESIEDFANKMSYLFQWEYEGMD